MQQAIDIRTLDGQRFDVYPNETIEVNMGGISLLNLADRTVSYTNSFKLPRTPNNEAIFQFASQPTRNDRPSIEVIISKGLFQKNATLKVKEFDGDYKCEVVYDSDILIEKLKNTNFYSLPLETIIHVFPPDPTDKEILNKFCERTQTNRYFTPVTYNHRVGDAGGGGNSNAITVGSLISIIETNLSISFIGDMLSDSFFMNSFIFNKYVYLELNYLNIEQVYSTSSFDVISISEIFKALSQIFCFDFIISGSTIELKSVINLIPLSGETIETLTNGGKHFSSGYAKENFIKYTIADKLVNENFGSDTILADGINNKTIIQLSSVIPPYFAGTYFGYDMTDKDVYKKICIMGGGVATLNTMRNSSIPYTANITSVVAAPVDMAGFYSSILNPIFANPVILSADGYIDPLTADTIMNNRVISSVKLGGRYWVDEMKYNLTTGKSVLKLIKL